MNLKIPAKLTTTPELLEKCPNAKPGICEELFKEGFVWIS